MTLNAKMGVLWIFWRFRAARHILRANCTKTNWDRHRKAVYDIFSIDRRFQWSKSRFSRFKKTCARRHQGAVPLKVDVLSLLASLSWKWLQIGIGMLPITTSTSDELFSCINIDDFEIPQTFEIWGFYWFLWSLAAAHTPRMNCDEMAVGRLTVCEQQLL